MQRTSDARTQRQSHVDVATVLGKRNPTYSAASYRNRHGEPADWTADECDESLDAMRAASPARAAMRRDER